MVPKEIEARIIEALIKDGYKNPQIITKEIMPGIYDVHMDSEHFGIWSEASNNFID